MGGWTARAGFGCRRCRQFYPRPFTASTCPTYRLPDCCHLPATCLPAAAVETHPSAHPGSWEHCLPGIAATLLPAPLPPRPDRLPACHAGLPAADRHLPPPRLPAALPAPCPAYSACAGPPVVPPFPCLLYTHEAALNPLHLFLPTLLPHGDLNFDVPFSLSGSVQDCHHIERRFTIYIVACLPLCSSFLTRSSAISASPYHLPSLTSTTYLPGRSFSRTPAHATPLPAPYWGLLPVPSSGPLPSTTYPPSHLQDQVLGRLPLQALPTCWGYCLPYLPLPAGLPWLPSTFDTATLPALPTSRT